MENFHLSTVLPLGCGVVDNKERRHCGDKGVAGSEHAALTFFLDYFKANLEIF